MNRAPTLKYSTHPIRFDRTQLMNIKKPNTRVYYDLQEIGTPDLEEVVAQFVKQHNLK